MIFIPHLIRRFSNLKNDEEYQYELNLKYKEKIDKEWAAFKLVLDYNMKGLSASLKPFMIGFSVVLLVVACVTIIENLQPHLQYLLILGTIENFVSSTDMLVASNNGSSAFLNYTKMEPLIKGTLNVEKQAPRWVIPVQLRNKKNGNTINANAFIIDSIQEKNDDLAPLWPYRPLGINEVHCTDYLLRNLELQPNAGDMFELSLNSSFFKDAKLTGQPPAVPLGNRNLTDTNVEIINAMEPGFTLENKNGQSYMILPNDSISNVGEIRVSFQIIDAIDKGYGLFPNAIGNIIVLDKSAMYYFVTSVISTTSIGSSPVDIEELTNNVKSTVNFNEYVAFVTIVMSNRYLIYSSPFSTMEKNLVKLSNVVADSLNNDPGIALNPLIGTALKVSQMGSYFMNETFFATLFVIIILSIAVINALMNKDVAEKSYEYGMLRAIGLSKKSLIYYLFQKVMLFAIPGIVLGLVVAYLFNLSAAYYVSISIGNDIRSSLKSIWLSVLIGLFLPIVGIILPIGKAIRTTLRDALDKYTSAVGETVLKIERLRAIGFAPLETTMAMIFVTFGFLVYYMIPLSYILGDFGLFFRVFTLILMGLLIGLTIIGQFLLPPLEMVVAFVLTKVYDGNLTEILFKNLSAHRAKNRYTSLVFTLCLSYIIFVSVMFNAQTNSFRTITESAIGCDVRLTASGFDAPLERETIRDFLFNKTTNVTGFSNVVTGFSFATFDILEYYPVNYESLSSMSGLASLSSSIFGIEKSYYSSIYPDFVMSNNANVLSKKADVVSLLYNFKNVQYKPDMDYITSTVVYDNINTKQREMIPFIANQPNLELLYFPLSTKGELNFLIQQKDQLYLQPARFIVEPVASITKMSGYPEISSLSATGAMFITIDDFESLILTIDSIANTNITEYANTTIPMKDCFIKFSADSTDFQIEEFMSDLNSILGKNVVVNELRIYDKSTSVATINGRYGLAAVSIAAMLLCFFVLIVSFESNVKDNSWEYGVLRSLGFTKTLLTRLYIYEALCIVVSATVLGTLNGCIVGFMFCMQTNVFLEMPWKFDFPSGFYSFILCLACVFAVVSSVIPARELNAKSISSTLKGGS